MKIGIFMNKLGQETAIVRDFTPIIQGEEILPMVGDLISIDDEVYKVKQVLKNYVNDCYDVFVKVHDWE